MISIVVIYSPLSMSILQIFGPISHNRYFKKKLLKIAGFRQRGNFQFLSNFLGTP